MRQKLNVLLARAEHSAKQYQQLIQDYIETFAKNQGLFKGKRTQYLQAPGQEDDPMKRGFDGVQSTVGEYLKWFEDTVEEFVNHRFSVEATNATGVKAELIVEGKSCGEFSSLELMRLNDLLNNATLTKLYTTLPVRSDSKTWKLSEEREFKERGIHETEAREQPYRAGIKGWRILDDPNLQHLKGNQTYTPVKVEDDKVILLGTQTIQEFSGELSHVERAKILRRLTLLKAAVKEALVIANENPTVESTMTAKKIFGYLHYGTI